MPDLANHRLALLPRFGAVYQRHVVEPPTTAAVVARIQDHLADLRAPS